MWKDWLSLLAFIFLPSWMIPALKHQIQSSSVFGLLDLNQWFARGSWTFSHRMKVALSTSLLLMFWDSYWLPGSSACRRPIVGLYLVLVFSSRLEPLKDASFPLYPKSSIKFLGLKNAVVTQFSRHRIIGTGKEFILQCSQNMNHVAMYWYRQDPGLGLKLVYYSPGPGIIEKGDVSEGYHVSRNTRASSPRPWSLPAPTRHLCISVPAVHPQHRIATSSPHTKRCIPKRKNLPSKFLAPNKRHFLTSIDKKSQTL